MRSKYAVLYWPVDMAKKEQVDIFLQGADPSEPSSLGKEDAVCY
jgi:hypothetical protein